ncbi:organic cation transporter protein-like [Mytilus galloprovincialis]|uniref:organic cation transporter protein-like n=1 Tax=Mytilus galloprovincialis TaxID=29158 RepID=UPI003F7C3AC2
MHFDEILEKIGEFGLYQKFLYTLLCIPGISAGVFMVISVFLLGIPDHRCVIPGYENDTYTIQNDYHQSLVNHYIPKPTEEKKKYDECSYWAFNSSTVLFDNESRPINASTVKCTKWVYDDAIFASTFSSEMNLVCDDFPKTTQAKTLFFGGVLVGAFITGMLSDKIGRKKTLFLSFLLALGATVGLAFSPSYPVFVTLRFFVGFSMAGIFMTAFVIGLELVGPTKRNLAGIVIEYFFALGLVLLAGVAYLLRDWFYIELAFGAPMVLFLLMWWVIPESPRWLINQGRKEEAEVILRKAAKVNKVTLPDKLFMEEDEEEPPTGHLLHLFTSRVLLVRTLVIFFNWMVVSMTYYGLSLNTGNLGGDFYMNFFISGLVEFPAYTLSILFLDRIGRKICHLLAMVIGGGCCLATIFTIIYGGEDLQWLTTTLAMIGKLGSAAAFAIIYVFSAELYPTVVRNTGMGASSCCARVGGMIAPYVADSAKIIGGDFGHAVPLAVFGAASVLAGLLSLLLPETLGEHLPESIEDGVIFGTDQYREKKARKYKSSSNDLLKIEMTKF